MTALHPLHRLWRGLPAGPRRWAFSQATRYFAPRPDQPPPAARGGVAIGGEIGRASGLGEGARLMDAGLRALGVPVWSFAAGAESAPDAPVVLPAGVPLVLHVNAPMLPAALLRLPRGLLRGRRVIGYWAWELPTLPDAWRDAGGSVHDIWAPSRFTAAALEQLAPGRVRVVPHPVAVRPPQPSALTRADFGLPADAFVVLTSFSLASSFARKNPLAAIAAFGAAFGHAPDRILVLKVSHAAHYPADMDRLRAAIANAPNIRLETRLFPTEDSHALTACSDAVLSLHRSEGFGLVPAEAMLLGKPVVATDWSGTTDFLDASCGMPVAYTLVPARDPRGVFEAPGAEWAEADIAAAGAALRALADDAALRAALGGAAMLRARERFGTAALAAAVRDLGLAVQA